MKNIKQLFWIPPLALLVAGCAADRFAVVGHPDPILSEWQAYGEMLPPTGMEPSRVYAEPQMASYPSERPDIIVQSSQNSGSGDALVADAIRRDIEFDRGLAPSLTHVTIIVENGRLTLQGSVRSDLDSRVIVDNLRDIVGVTQITNRLEINPYID
ncbi:MAG TPA: BON domain-containing protein [Candidatus Polarisedimenticolia bacterium]|nr:BON domain-containing protein [Candidatus Polarisedimenticolia bacterium]